MVTTRAVCYNCTLNIISLRCVRYTVEDTLSRVLSEWAVSLQSTTECFSEIGVPLMRIQRTTEISQMLVL